MAAALTVLAVGCSGGGGGGSGGGGSGRPTPSSISPPTTRLADDVMIDGRIAVVAPAVSADLSRHVADLVLVGANRAGRNGNVEVTGGYTGAFTNPASVQTVYLVRPTDAIAADPIKGHSLFAIIEDDRLIDSFNLPPSSWLVRRTDLDHNGVTEVVVANRATSGGVVVEQARLMRFDIDEQGNHLLTVVADFGSTLENACGSGRPDTAALAAEVRTGPPRDGKITFATKKFRARCSSGGAADTSSWTEDPSATFLNDPSSGSTSESTAVSSTSTSSG